MTERRPAATLLLLCYNQEEYIEEAVRSALAQDFEPLEIIISDDVSTDRSWEKIEAMVERLDSRHSVIARRPDRNLGLVRHFWESAQLAKGDLIVVAAGDDISYPGRVSALMRAWRDTAATALFSDWDVIDSTGRILANGRIKSRVRDGIRLDRYFPGRAVEHIMGTSSAYARSFLLLLDQPPEGLYAEDFFMTLMIGAMGGTIIECPQRLLAYRVHDAALTNRNRGAMVVADEESLMRRMADWQRRQLQWFERFSERQDRGFQAIDHSVIAQDIAFLEARANWPRLSFARRIEAVRDCPEQAWRRWMIPRLLGEGPLRLGKALRGRLRSWKADRRD